MHPNPIYHTGSEVQNLEFARQAGFGMLAVGAGSADQAPMLSHVPFVLAEDGRSAELHLVRSNPIARKMPADGMAARIAVQGPHGYISPDWYGIEDQVPTWNYVAVHLTGRLRPLDVDELRGALDRLSDQFEARLAPKPIWKTDKVGEEPLARLMRMILPYRFDIETVDGTWKLAQNKEAPARNGAADGLETSGIGSDLAALAAMMRGV